MRHLRKNCGGLGGSEDKAGSGDKRKVQWTGEGEKVDEKKEDGTVAEVGSSSGSKDDVSWNISMVDIPSDDSNDCDWVPTPPTRKRARVEGKRGRVASRGNSDGNGGDLKVKKEDDGTDKGAKEEAGAKGGSSQMAKVATPKKTPGGSGKPTPKTVSVQRSTPKSGVSRTMARPSRSSWSSMSTDKDDKLKKVPVIDISSDDEEDKRPESPLPLPSYLSVHIPEEDSDEEPPKPRVRRRLSVRSRPASGSTPAPRSTPASPAPPAIADLVKAVLNSTPATRAPQPYVDFVPYEGSPLDSRLVPLPVRHQEYLKEEEERRQARRRAGLPETEQYVWWDESTNTATPVMDRPW